MENSIKRVSSR